MRRRFIYNEDNFKQVRVLLRKNQTEAEEFVWNLLRRKPGGVKWYRQYSVGKFILDFYCPKKKVAIELDGGIHCKSENLIYDKNRTDFLNLHRINVVRFRNEQVKELGKTIPLP